MAQAVLVVQVAVEQPSAAASAVTSAASIPTEVRFSVMFGCTYRGDAFATAPLEATAAAPKTPLVPVMLFTYTKTGPATNESVFFFFFRLVCKRAIPLFGAR